LIRTISARDGIPQGPQTCATGSVVAFPALDLTRKIEDFVRAESLLHRLGNHRGAIGDRQPGSSMNESPFAALAIVSAESGGLPVVGGACDSRRSSWTSSGVTPVPSDSAISVTDASRPVPPNAGPDNRAR
jgi:hypothetical protein